MKGSYSVIEREGRYWLSYNDRMYITPFYLNISSEDKGLVEAAARKIEEGKPTLVMRYLCKYSNEELVKLMQDLKVGDIYWYRYSFTNDPELCASSFSNLQLRKLIDAYTDCGSMGLACHVASKTDYSPRLCARIVEACFAENGCGIDMENMISDDDAEVFMNKYQGFLIPAAPKAKSRFEALLLKFEIEEEDDYSDWDDEEDEYEEDEYEGAGYEGAGYEPDAYDMDCEEDAESVARRMTELDEETLRQFNVVRDFVSKHQDFWADFEDCDAVYRPFFHAGDGEKVMRFWFNPPLNGQDESYPCESDKIVLTKSGKILVEDHGDGRFYNILDCIGHTLENAVYAIETLGK